jgi:halocyanin-like protein
MAEQTAGRSVERRTVLGGIGSLAAAGLLAGCTTGTDGGEESPGDGGSGGGDDSGTPTESGSGAQFDQAAVDEYLSNVSNYDGTVVDEQGSSSVTVAVGVEGNGGNYAFSPPAVIVDAGTTIQFEWTGQGQQHNVVHEGGDYESELYAEAGVNFEHTFDSAGLSRYFCRPHKGLGMKGVVVVV